MTRTFHPLKKSIALLAISLLFTACGNNSGQSNQPVETPNSNLFQVPDAPACVAGVRFTSQNDYCHRIRDDQNLNCGSQIRYDDFKHRCHGMKWQDRH